MYTLIFVLAFTSYYIYETGIEEETKNKFLSYPETEVHMAYITTQSMNTNKLL